MDSRCPNCSTLAGDAAWAPCNQSDAADLNLTDEELVLKYLGPRRSELFAPICATYLLVFVVGAVGNALTCTVILRHPAMRTPTNLYLFSLAVADLLVLLLGLPLELYELWSNYPFVLGAAGCFFRTLLFETVCLASVLNVTALSAERFVAVLQPLRARRLGTRARVRRVLGVLWAMALLCALPNASLHGLHQLQLPCRGAVPGSTICTLVRSQQAYNLLMQVTTLLFFCLPMGTISVLYLLIGLRLRRERQLLQPEARGGALVGEAWRLQRQDRGRTQVTKMLFVLVVVFAVCWAPFHTERLLWSFIENPNNNQRLDAAYYYVHIVSGVFFYLSSAANPVLYSLMSTRFRETFQEALGLGGRCGRRRPPRGSHSLSRVTTGSTLVDLGTPVCRQQKTFPSCRLPQTCEAGTMEGPQDLHPNSHHTEILPA